MGKASEGRKYTFADVVVTTILDESVDVTETAAVVSAVAKEAAPTCICVAKLLCSRPAWSSRRGSSKGEQREKKGINERARVTVESTVEDSMTKE